MARVAWLLPASLLVACASTPPPAQRSPTPAPTAVVAPVGPKQPTEAAGGGGGAPLTPDSVAARVNGDAITIREVDQRLEDADKQIIAQAQQDPAFAAHALATARLRTLQELIDTRLLLRAAEREFVVVTDAEIDEAVLAIEKQNSLTRAELEKVLADNGFTTETYRRELRDQIAIARVVNQSNRTGATPQAARAALVKELRSRAKITISIQEPPPPSAATAPTAPTPAQAVLTVADLEKTLGRPLGRFEERALSDLPTTATYASHHFKSFGNAESHDLAFRVWRHPAKAARAELAILQRDIADTRPITGLGSAAFKAFAKDTRVFGVGFVDDPTSLVVLVTCGADLCKSHDETLAVAKLLHTRLDRLAGMLR